MPKITSFEHGVAHMGMLLGVIEDDKRIQRNARRRAARAKKAGLARWAKREVNDGTKH